MDIVVALPWPVGIVLGIVLFLGIRYGIGAYLSSAPTGMFRQIGPSVSKAIAPFSWLGLIACWVAAGYSFSKKTGVRVLFRKVHSDLCFPRRLAAEFVVGEREL